MIPAGIYAPYPILSLWKAGDKDKKDKEEKDD